jgi:hypothetical protein
MVGGGSVNKKSVSCSWVILAKIGGNPVNCRSLKEVLLYISIA